MVLAGAEAVAAKAQPSGKGGKIVSLKNCEIQFIETDIYCMHSGSFGHLQLKM